jgi:methylated-DNA-protein-cysteine methyltransferase-like protein
MRARFYEEVYALVRRIPAGRVTTYGAIADALGYPHWARQVGWAMAALDDDEVPAHRVVSATGALSGSRLGVEWRRSLLEAEGVQFEAQGRVRMRRYFWQPDNLVEASAQERH